jgi:hypothetical protein
VLTEESVGSLAHRFRKCIQATFASDEFGDNFVLGLGRRQRADDVGSVVNGNQWLVAFTLHFTVMNRKAVTGEAE